MSNWRRKVLSLFPEMRREAQRPDFSIYMVFFKLLPRVLEAHLDGDAETLRRIYGFAEWCSEQKAKDMWNSAAVCFYEHLFDSHRSLWPEFVCWLSPKVVADVWGLWEWRLTENELTELQRLIAACRRPLYQHAHLSSRRPMTGNSHL